MGRSIGRFNIVGVVTILKWGSGENACLVNLIDLLKPGREGKVQNHVSNSIVYVLHLVSVIW